MEHLTDPERKVYFLTMEALLFEVDMETLEAKLLFDLAEELDIPARNRCHFKGGYTGHGRVVVANNTHMESDFLGQTAHGRLAEWDGSRWIVLAETPHMEVIGHKISPRHVCHRLGPGLSGLARLRRRKMERVSLTKASHTFDHWWQTEWTRIRE